MGTRISAILQSAGVNRMTKKKTTRADAIQQAADYIINILDSEPWKERLEKAAYCRNCPARQGGVLDNDDIDHVCSFCPLRPYMMALAELELRSKRKKP